MTAKWLTEFVTDTHIYKSVRINEEYADQNFKLGSNYNSQQFFIPSKSIEIQLIPSATVILIQFFAVNWM